MAVAWKVDLYGGKVNAEKVYEELGEKNQTPEEIVEMARNNPDSELHRCFEWNNDIAAEKYRLQQARTIMCNLVFVTEDKKDEARVFYNLTFEKSEYHPTKLILQKPDEYMALLEKAKGELQAFKKKYSMLKELKNIFDDIEAL